MQPTEDAPLTVSFPWKIVHPLSLCEPGPSCCGTMVHFSGSLFLFGGGIIGKMTSKLFEFNLQNLCWTDHGQAYFYGVHPRLGHSAVVVNDLMIVHGGLGMTQAFNDTFSYNFEKREWKTLESKIDGRDLPVRKVHAAASYNGKMYVLMGQGYDGLPFYKDFLEFDPVLLQWRVVQSDVARCGGPPLGLCGHSVCVCGDYLYVFGGMISRTEYTSSTFRFHFPSGLWQFIHSLTSPPSARYTHAMWCSGSLIFIHGGDTDNCCVYFDDLWVFDSSTIQNSLDLPAITWHNETKSMQGIRPVARSGHCVCAVNGVLYMFGGESPSTSSQQVRFSTALFQWPMALCLNRKLVQLAATWLAADRSKFYLLCRPLPAHLLALCEQFQDDEAKENITVSRNIGGWITVNGLDDAIY